jgi:hypothetical protein
VDELLALPEIVWDDVRELSDSLWSIYPEIEEAVPEAEV